MHDTTAMNQQRERRHVGASGRVRRRGGTGRAAGPLLEPLEGRRLLHGGAEEAIGDVMAGGTPWAVPSAAAPAVNVEAGVVRIDAGGGGFTDSANHVWSADRSFSGGTVSTGAYAVGKT